MRILIINTSENNGGAAVASSRLLSALNNYGLTARMLVRDKAVNGSESATAAPGHLRQRLAFLWERFCVWLHLGLRKEHLWEVDIANAGLDITETKEFQQADIIHLAWINQGMLSIVGIRKILESGKPVVWTMHDLWPAVALCHYARGCERFHARCHHCPLLPKGGGRRDLSWRIWGEKRRAYKNQNITFVTCSRWLEGQAQKSRLLEGCRLTAIPNPIDTNLFRPREKKTLREKLSLPQEKKLILFAAQKLTDERKGTVYFLSAIERLCQQYPLLAERSALVLLGGRSAELPSLEIETIPLGYVSGERNLAEVYAAIDTLVLPSMEDNLPNTIMEAMASGAPCVGFNVGGIPEMIDHLVNGFIAEPGNVEQLTEGIVCVLDAGNYLSMSRNAVAKIKNCYSESSVAQQYTAVYEEAMKKKSTTL